MELTFECRYKKLLIHCEFLLKFWHSIISLIEKVISHSVVGSFIHEFINAIMKENISKLARPFE